MVPTNITLTVLSMGAFAALTVACVILWKRTRSVPTAIAAVGFGLVLPDQVSSIIEYLRFNSLIRGNPGDTFFLIHHHAVLRYISIVGLWVAAVGLLWHSGRKSAQ